MNDNYIPSNSTITMTKQEFDIAIDNAISSYIKNSVKYFLINPGTKGLQINVYNEEFLDKDTRGKYAIKFSLLNILAEFAEECIIYHENGKVKFTKSYFQPVKNLLEAYIKNFPEEAKDYKDTAEHKLGGINFKLTLDCWNDV